MVHSRFRTAQSKAMFPLSVSVVAIQFGTIGFSDEIKMGFHPFHFERCKQSEVCSFHKKYYLNLCFGPITVAVPGILFFCYRF